MRGLRREDGQILPLLMLVMLGMVAMGVLVVGIGRATILRSRAQTAADAAALAGARNLRDQLIAQAARDGFTNLAAIDKGQVQAAAEDYAHRNGAHLVAPYVQIIGTDVRAWADTDEDQSTTGGRVDADSHGAARARARVTLGASPTGAGLPAGGGGGSAGGGAFKPFTDKDWKDVAKQLKHHPPQCTDDPETNDVAILGRMLKAHGAQILANAAVGTTPHADQHVNGSWHMRCGGSGALDVNFDQTGREPEILDSIVDHIQKLGFFTIWRAPGHTDHMHVDASGGTPIGAGTGVGGPGGDLEDATLEIQLVDWDAPAPTGPASAFVPGPGGIPFGGPEADVANAACQILDRYHAPPLARLALWEALIQESGVTNITWGTGGSVGPLQLIPAWGSVEHRRDVNFVISYFLLHGYYGKGGAIALAHAHPDWSAGTVAQAVQGSKFPYAYDPWKQTAMRLNQQFCHGEGNLS
jgi:putative Flp pilus-assembly TadE/G-like protein